MDEQGHSHVILPFSYRKIKEDIHLKYIYTYLIQAISVNHQILDVWPGSPSKLPLHHALPADKMDATLEFFFLSKYSFTCELFNILVFYEQFAYKQSPTFMYYYV